MLVAAFAQCEPTRIELPGVASVSVPGTEGLEEDHTIVSEGDVCFCPTFDARGRTDNSRRAQKMPGERKRVVGQAW